MSGPSIQELNRQLARKIDEEARNDPRSPLAGKFVGIANGQIVSVADNADDAICQLLQIESDPSKLICIEAGIDYSEVQEIWESD